MMDEQVSILATINGREVSAIVPARLSLADFLRDRLGLTGTNVGCEHGVCGACTIIVDGQIARSCLFLAAQVDGRVVETIEAAAATGRVATLQATFVRRNALQCGFCTPGILLTASALLEQTPQPTRDEIREYLSGNYCRCTGYQAIVDAIEEASKSTSNDTEEGSRRDERITGD